jgi:REP element-mobilizing transposase RayT
VLTRGALHQVIYRDATDRARFLDLVARVIIRRGWSCHAYCLMGTHYHLLIETRSPNLPNGMHELNGLYAQGFNRRHAQTGHVFEARYRSILVETDSHLLEVARYVVLNPVRAGLCTEPGDWPWSSFRATAGFEPVPEWLSTDRVLGQFADSRSAAVARYRDFVADASRQRG